MVHSKIISKGENDISRGYTVSPPGGIKRRRQIAVGAFAL